MAAAMKGHRQAATSSTGKGASAHGTHSSPSLALTWPRDAARRSARSRLGAASILVVALASGVPPAGGAEVGIDADGMLVVDGRRVFVVGLYGAPKDPGALRDAAVSGFNLVKTGAGNPLGLDRLWFRGLWGWAGLPVGPGPEASGSSALPWSGVSSAVREHPALLLWEQPDEALWGCWWPALEWRRTTEPARQSERLAMLPGGDQRKQRLLANRLRADELFRGGDIEAAEVLADELWRELDGALPHEARSLRDAPACAAERAAELRERYGAVKGEDPCHPVWINHAPRNRQSEIEAFNLAADIVSCDIYPVPAGLAGHSDLADQSMTSVGAYTRLMKQAAGGRPVFMVIQAFAWGDLEQRNGVSAVHEKPAPTLEEMRFMTFDAIVHGARGVLYYGTRLSDRGSQVWGDLCLLGTELLALRDVLAAPDAGRAPEVRLGPTWTSDGAGIAVLAKDVNGEPWFVVVNENREPLTYSLCGLSRAAGVVVAEHEGGVVATVADGCALLRIGGYGAQILRQRGIAGQTAGPGVPPWSAIDQ